MFKNNISSKDLKGSQGQDKVSWIKEMLHTFCDMYQGYWENAWGQTCTFTKLDWNSL